MCTSQTLSSFDDDLSIEWTTDTARDMTGDTLSDTQEKIGCKRTNHPEKHSRRKPWFSSDLRRLIIECALLDLNQ
jgi:hypothetical protein